ncbi:MAG: hypothetical protein M1831_001417 [Alyxoria varia]|nr:MAG: hypothetical protein M1831_001417 [Alyxoria varia]
MASVAPLPSEPEKHGIRIPEESSAANEASMALDAPVNGVSTEQNAKSPSPQKLVADSSPAPMNGSSLPPKPSSGDASADVVDKSSPPEQSDKFEVEAMDSSSPKPVQASPEKPNAAPSRDVSAQDSSLEQQSSPQIDTLKTESPLEPPKEDVEMSGVASETAPSAAPAQPEHESPKDSSPTAPAGQATETSSPAASETSPPQADLSLSDAQVSPTTLTKDQHALASPEPQSFRSSSNAPNSKVREREEDENEDEPSAKRSKQDEAADAASAEGALPDALEQPDATAEPAPSPAAGADEATAPPLAAQPASGAAAAVPVRPEDGVDYGPLTDLQQKRLLEGMRNIKKGKHAPAFGKPVDYVALNLTRYPEVIKKPMDLGTMEGKLKEKKYGSVNEYIADFDLMVNNALVFNGSGHPVAQAGTMLRSQLSAQLKKVPKPGDPVVEQTPPKKASFSREAKRRESRASTGNAAPKAANPPPAAAPAPVPPTAAAAPTTPAAPSSPSAPAAPSATEQAPTTHAPGPDGLPIIRRESIVDRPKRKIQKPAPRDLSYPKPAKKKFQLEFKFCNHVLNEMKNQKKYPCVAPFMVPVDPVALNIPEYFKVIKKPMDLSTIDGKMKNNEYENPKEFEADMKHIVANCYKFNPVGNAVRGLGEQFETLFKKLWEEKKSWLAENDPAATPADESAEASEEEEEDENDAEPETAAGNAQLAALHEQITKLQEQTAAIMAGSNLNAGAQATKKGGKAKDKTKQTTQQKKRKSSTGGAAAQVKAPEKKPKPKPKKPAPKKKTVTQKEKQEISDRVGQLSNDSIGNAMAMIKDSLRKAGRHDLANCPDEEIEMDIETIPDDALRGLLDMIRRELGTVAPSGGQGQRAVEQPAAAQTTGGKKRKPMTKAEQQEQLARLQGKLNNFENVQASIEGGDPENEASEEDEDDSGSESEEE